MKKLTLVLALAAVLVAVVIYQAYAVPNCVCYGTVITDTHLPLAGATITLTYNGWTAVSGADGTFHLYLQGSYLHPGNYTISVSKTDWITKTKNFYFDSTNTSGTNVGTIVLWQ